MKETTEDSEATAVTEALHAWKEGDLDALGEVFEKVRVELRRTAAAQMAKERGEHTLQPTALVNELYLRLLGPTDIDWKDRRHFFAIAARTMGQVLIDHARKRNTEKRGASYETVSLDDSLDLPKKLVSAVDLGIVLMDLEEFDARKRKVVEYHCLGHLAIKDCAELLDISMATAKRDWRFARAWLVDYLNRGGHGE